MINYNDLTQKTVAEVVSNNIKTAHVFKKYGIDFCCGGNVSIQKACENKNIDIATLYAEIDETIRKNAYVPSYETWPLPFLITYIVNMHHAYVTESLHLLDQYVEKVVRVHGQNHPPLLEIKVLYQELANEMRQHMRKEEAVLFPYIQSLAAAQTSKQTPPTPPFGSISNPIGMMQTEHDAAGDICRKIAVLTQQYQPPIWACNTFKALYAKLAEFEEDLHIHVHLENNILFPKALLLEKQVLSN